MNGLAVILLAAGASSRMGTPKLLLPWGGKTVLGHLLALWRQLGAEQVGVVCAPGAGPLVDELDRLEVAAHDRMTNPHPERGMFSSIQAAANWGGWRSGLRHWAIVLGDQPQLSLATLRALLDFAAEHPARICQPSYRGRPRHPVVVGRGSMARLRDTAAGTLKQFLEQEHPCPALCEMDEPALDVDLDTPAEYEAALRMFGGITA